MIELKKDDCFLVCGGLNVSSSLISAFSSGIKIILEVGRSLGSAIRRGCKNNLCPI